MNQQCQATSLAGTQDLILHAIISLWYYRWHGARYLHLVFLVNFICVVLMSIKIWFLLLPLMQWTFLLIQPFLLQLVSSLDLWYCCVEALLCNSAGYSACLPHVGMNMKALLALA